MNPQQPDDPFAAFGSERTVIKPAAGRAAREPAGADPAGSGQWAAPAPSAEATLTLEALMGGSLNPLVAAAAPLLVAAPRIRRMPRHADPLGLRESLAEGVRRFEAHARSQGLPNEHVVAARYVLCTLLDESAASTPWGSSRWSTQSLLVQFHNETWGGEKVFQLLSKLAANVDGNRPLLELLYVTLALGFEGRYRVMDNGRAQLDSVRQRLQQLLQQGRPVDKALSPRWQGRPDAGTAIGHGLPLWLIGSAVALVLGLIYIGLRLALASHADTVFGPYSALNVRAEQLAAPAMPAAPPAKPRLSVLLKPDIDAGLVRVQDLADRSVVTIKGDGFFEPGSAEVAAAVQALLPRVAAALQQVPGQVLIVGHSDNVPIRTVRFPSNWHLSQARADTVRQQLATTVPAQRLRAEGRAESEPVADNATPAGRALNRRIDITLFVQQP